MSESNKTPSRIALAKAACAEVVAGRRGPYHGEDRRLLLTVLHELHIMRALDSPQHLDELKLEAKTAMEEAERLQAYATQQKNGGNKEWEQHQKIADQAKADAQQLLADIGGAAPAAS